MLTGRGTHGRWRVEAAVSSQKGIDTCFPPSPPPHTCRLPADRPACIDWWNHGDQLLRLDRCHAISSAYLDPDSLRHLPLMLYQHPDICLDVRGGMPAPDRDAQEGPIATALPCQLLCARSGCSGALLACMSCTVCEEEPETLRCVVLLRY